MINKKHYLKNGSKEITLYLAHRANSKSISDFWTTDSEINTRYPNLTITKCGVFELPDGYLYGEIDGEYSIYNEKDSSCCLYNEGDDVYVDDLDRTDLVRMKCLGFVNYFCPSEYPESESLM